jgi:glycosyltransferase involved in cell wall biosynthesis
MPVYNGALYIRDAIRSVLNQTVIPQEIIVSDSGSSDGTINIIRDHAEGTRVNLIILATKTPGMVANWNSTIRAASGKYIKFLFQDDLLHPNCLEEMVKVAECDERIGFVFSPRELLIEPSAEGDEITKWLLRYQNLSAVFGELKTSQPGSLLLRSQELLEEPLNKIGEPTAVLVRTVLFHEVGLFNERMRQLVDMEMWIRLMAVSHVGYISKALGSVRIHPQRASNRHATEEIYLFERDCLCDTLRTPTIYPLLHWRVRRALRLADGRRSLQWPVQALSSYIRRYAAALRQLRRVRTVAQHLTFDKAYAFAEAEIGIVQKPEEIRWLFELVRAAGPRVVLEIGIHFGGTFFLWSRAAAPDAHLLAIDTKPVGRFGMWSPFSLVRRGFVVGSQRVTLLMDSDSHSETTRQRIAALLDGRAIDFLFIHGDHSHDGVWQDFKTYSPFVAPGGLVAFHDISQNPTERTTGVAQFWREFTVEHETEERVVNDQPGFGIGVYRVPGSHSNARASSLRAQFDK